MVYYQHDDGRVCIVFPFMDKVIMGSTDIRVADPDAARCEADEIEYMMTTLRGVFPEMKIAREDIVFTFCGVRPLPASEGTVLANVSRGHSVRVAAPEGERPFPVYSLIGGKWTTFRAFAEQVADRVMGDLGAARRCSTVHEAIGGGKGYPSDAGARAEWVAHMAQASRSAEARVATLLERYGTAAETYAAAESGEGARPLASLPTYTVGEIRRMAAAEDVEHLADLVCRRSTIALLGEATGEVLREIAGIAGDVLGWDAARQAAEVARASAEVVVPGGGAKGRGRG